MYVTALAVAIIVRDGTITSSPGPMSSAASASGPARRGHATSGADPGAEQLLKLADIGAEVTDVPAGGGITDRPVLLYRARVLLP